MCCTLASREGELTGAKRGAQRRDAEPALSHAPPALRSGRGKRQPPTQPGLSAAVADCLRTRETQLFPRARKKRGERSQHLRIAPGDRGEAKEESGPGGAAPGGGSARTAARAPLQCSRSSPIFLAFCRALLPPVLIHPSLLGNGLPHGPTHSPWHQGRSNGII